MKSEYEYAKLKFFRDLNQEERVKVFKVFGDFYDIPEEQFRYQAVQAVIFHKLFNEGFK